MVDLGLGVFTSSRIVAQRNTEPNAQDANEDGHDDVDGDDAPKRIQIDGPMTISSRVVCVSVLNQS